MKNIHVTPPSEVAYFNVQMHTFLYLLLASIRYKACKYHN